MVIKADSERDELEWKWVAKQLGGRLKKLK